MSLDEWREKLNVNPTDDQGRVGQAALEEAKTYLRKKQPFVWNATNITRDRRSKLINIFSEYHAKVRLVYIEVPYKQIILRNKERPYASQLPTKALEKMIDSLEVPLIYEAPIVEYIAT